MRLIFCIGIIALFGYVGYSISSYYINKKKFYYCILNFVNNLKIQINFLEESLEKILNNEKVCNKDFMRLIENYKKMLYKQSCLKDDLFIGISILSEQEEDVIYNFFKTLGRLDMENQITIIDNFIGAIDNYYVISKNDCNKYSGLYTKLGIIIGAFLSLIII